MKQDQTERLASLLLFAPDFHIPYFGADFPGARPFSPQPSAQANGCDLPTQKMIGKNGHSSQMVREDWNHLKRKVPRKSITKWQSGRFFCDVWESHPKKSFIQRGTGYIIHSNAYFRVFRDVKYHDSDQVILHPDLDVATSLIAHYTSGFHIMNV